MSKIFGSFHKSIVSGQFLENNKKLQNDKNFNNDNNGGFALPGTSKVFRRNGSFKSGLLLNENTNIHPLEMCEDISKIDFENRNECNGPSTSTSFFQCKTKSCNSSNRFEFNRNRIYSSMFCPSPRKAIYNSRLQYQNEDSHCNNGFNEVSVSKSFGLGRRNILTSTGFLKEKNHETVDQNSEVGKSNYDNREQNTLTTALPPDPGLYCQSISRLNPALNYRSENTIVRRFGLRSGSIPSESTSERIYKSNTNSISSFRSLCSDIAEPSRLRFASESNLYKNVNEPKKIFDGNFVKPAAFRPVKPPQSSSISSISFSNNYEANNRNISNLNFNVSHISKKDSAFSYPRYLSNYKQKKDEQYVEGSITSFTSMKSEFHKVIENLHYSLLIAVPNVPAEIFRREFDKAKEVCIRVLFQIKFYKFFYYLHQNSFLLVVNFPEIRHVVRC